MTKGPRLTPYHGDLIDLRSGQPRRAATKREAEYGARMAEEHGPPGVFNLDGEPVFVRQKPESPAGRAVAGDAPRTSSRRLEPLPDDFSLRIDVPAGAPGPSGKRAPVQVTVLDQDPDDDPTVRRVLLATKVKRQNLEAETRLRLLPNGRVRLERDQLELAGDGYDLLDAAVGQAIAEGRRLHAEAVARRGGR